MKKQILFIISVFSFLLILPLVISLGPHGHTYINDRIRESSIKVGELSICFDGGINERAFLCGSEASDLSVIYYYSNGGKNYKATHNWLFQQEVMNLAVTEDEKCFSYGIAQHLIVDSVLHTQIVPAKEDNPFYKRKHTESTRKRIREVRANQIFPFEDSSPEIKIQTFLRLLHIDFLIHCYMNIEHTYRCDIFIPVQEGIIQKTIIEYDGDYWHANPIFYNEEELNQKQIGQRERDKKRTIELQNIGFKVIRLWGSEIDKITVDNLKQKISEIK